MPKPSKRATLKPQKPPRSTPAVSNQKVGVRIGLLGGGQLARLLILEGHQLGFEMHVLCPRADEPAALVTRHWHQGDPHNKKHILEFCKKIDVLSFESEFFHGELLEEINEQGSIEISPAPRVMRKLQDRLSQKEALAEYKVPTADFLVIHNADDLHMAAEHFKNKLVLKKRFGGYDGNGTYVVRRHQDLAPLIEKLPLTENQFIAEAFIPFKRELALIFARNARGEIVHLPLVQTQQTDNRLDWLQGPVTHRQATGLIRQIENFLEKIKYVGAIGFELFDTGQELLVNEVAPRVHNSGHYSQDALTESQFALHLKAILNWPLATPQLRAPAFVSLNLIGQSQNTVSIPKKMSGHMHWYGKSENRPGRKMGHLNYTGKTPEPLLMMALKERGKFKL